MSLESKRQDDTHSSDTAVVWFIDDDRGYLSWLDQHPDGFVVNLRRRIDPGYVVLHRASCRKVQSYPKMGTNPGGFTERGYIKLCADNPHLLEQSLKKRWGTAISFSKRCMLCCK